MVLKSVNQELQNWITNKNTSIERNAKTLTLILISDVLLKKIANLFLPYSTCYGNTFIVVKLFYFLKEIRCLPISNWTLLILHFLLNIYKNTQSTKLKL